MPRALRNVMLEPVSELNSVRRLPLLRKAAGVDWLGISLLIIAIGTLQYTIERGNHLDWFHDPLIRATAVIAVFSIVGFIWHEMHTPHPVVDLRVLRNKPLRLGCIYGAAFGVGLYGSIFLFPIFTQGLLGWTSWKSGMAVLPSTITTEQAGFPFRDLAAAEGIVFPDHFDHDWRAGSRERVYEAVRNLPSGVTLPALPVVWIRPDIPVVTVKHRR